MRFLLLLLMLTCVAPVFAQDDEDDNDNTDVEEPITTFVFVPPVYTYVPIYRPPLSCVTSTVTTIGGATSVTTCY